jgi:hypothetical protein
MDLLLRVCFAIRPVRAVRVSHCTSRYIVRQWYVCEALADAVLLN